MSDTYRVQNRSVYPDEALDLSFAAGVPGSEGAAAAHSPDHGAEEAAWNPFVLGEPPGNFVHDPAAWMRPAPRISSLFDETPEFQPHLPSLADLIDLRMQRDEFSKILSELLEVRFGGNVRAMASSAGLDAEALALYLDGSALPKRLGGVHSLAARLSLDPEGFSFAWIYSSMRGFEDARRHSDILAPEFLKMRVMAQSAAFVLGGRIPEFEKPAGRGVPDISFTRLVDHLMMSLSAGFEEDAVYEVFSDCAWSYPAAATQMLEDPVKALEWFGGGPDRDAAIITMISTLQMSSGLTEDAVTLDINAGTIMDMHRNSDPAFNRRLDELKLGFYDRAMERARSIRGGVERLRKAGFEAAAESLRSELHGTHEAYWVNDILSDPLSMNEEGGYKPHAIERIFHRIFAEALGAGDPLFIDEAQVQNISEMGRMVLMLGGEIPLESRLSFYHMQHLIAALRRGGAPAEEILDRYGPAIKGLVAERRAELDLEGAPITAEQMAGQITDRLGGEYVPGSRMGLRDAVAFAYLGILAGIEPESAVETAASQMAGGAALYMAALEGASATVKKGHPYRAALTLRVAARRYAMDGDWCRAMQLSCAGGETMTKAHEKMGRGNLAVHDIMMWMRRDFFREAQEASREHIPRSMRAVREEFKGRIGAGKKLLTERPYLAGVSGDDLTTGAEAWSAFGDAARAHRRIVKTEFRPIRSAPHWEPSVYSGGAWLPSAGALLMAARPPVAIR